MKIVYFNYFCKKLHLIWLSGFLVHCMLRTGHFLSALYWKPFKQVLVLATTDIVYNTHTHTHTHTHTCVCKFTKKSYSETTPPLESKYTVPGKVSSTLCCQANFAQTTIPHIRHWDCVAATWNGKPYIYRFIKKCQSQTFLYSERR